MRWLVLLALGCSGQLEHELGAYRPAPPSTPPPASGSTGAPAPMTAPPAGPMAPTTTAPMTPTTTAPMMPPASGMAATTPPPASVCPPGVDALGLLASRCGDCHDAQDKAKGLDLVTPGLAARVVGVKSSCKNKLLLDPEAPAPAGQLLDKLRGPVPGCGQQMPYGMQPLTGPEVDCLVEWSARAVARARSGS